MMNAWTPMTSASPTARIERKSSAAAAPMRRPRWMTTRNRAEDGHDPDQPELLAEGRQREVGVDLRDGQPAADQRQAVAQAHADEPAAGERVERLEDLVAAVERVGPRVDPGGDAVADVGEHAGHQRAAEQEQDEADDDEADPTGRRVGQGQEDREEQQRRAEVALDDDDAQGDGPHRDHRREVRQGRQAERADARVLLDEQRPVLGQVAGQEHDEDDLEQLRRLAAERPEAQGQPRRRRSPCRTRTRAAAGRCRPPPRCTCSGAARCRSGRRCRASSAIRDAEHQPDQLDLAEPERPADDSLVTRSWGRRSMSSSEMPPSMPTVGQQDLVRAAAGQDLGEVGRWPGRRGRSPGPAGRTGRASPVTVRLSETLPTSRVSATRTSSVASVQRGRGRIGPRTRGRLADAGGAGGHAPAGQPASAGARTLQAQADLARSRSRRRSPAATARRSGRPLTIRAVGAAERPRRTSSGRGRSGRRGRTRRTGRR